MLASRESLAYRDENTPAAVSVDALSYAYPNGHRALEDVSIELRQGEKVALIGPNGAGKSTLLLHLNGIIKAQQGSVRIGGLETKQANLGRIRAMVGLVFQNPDDQLFSPRVFDDVAYGPLYMGLPEDEIRRRVTAALEAVDMGGFEERRPHELSIGERKRVALATVLSMDPAVLALDEPSAGLDPRARRGLINLLAGIDLTMLVSTHDMHLVKDLFRRIIVMDGGRVVADGPTEDILSDVELLERHGLEGT
jgi:cobalt transport protein ATP-binding subunit